MRHTLLFLATLSVLVSCSEQPKSQPQANELRVFIADNSLSSFGQSSQPVGDPDSSTSSGVKLRSTLSLMAMLKETCPDFTVTLDQELPNYTILVEKGSQEKTAGDSYSVGVFAGLLQDLVSVETGPSLKAGIQKACDVIRRNEKKQAKK